MSSFCSKILMLVKLTSAHPQVLWILCLFFKFKIYAIKLSITLNQLLLSCLDNNNSSYLLYQYSRSQGKPLACKIWLAWAPLITMIHPACCSLIQGVKVITGISHVICVDSLNNNNPYNLLLHHSRSQGKPLAYQVWLALTPWITMIHPVCSSVV